MQESTYYLITLEADRDAEQFERRLLNEIFPELQVLQRNVLGTSHALYSHAEGNQYLWVMTVEYMGGSARGVGNVPEQMRQAVEPYATLSSSLVEVRSTEDPMSGEASADTGRK